MYVCICITIYACMNGGMYPLLSEKALEIALYYIYMYVCVYMCVCIIVMYASMHVCMFACMHVCMCWNLSYCFTAILIIIEGHETAFNGF